MAKKPPMTYFLETMKSFLNEPIEDVVSQDGDAEVRLTATAKALRELVWYFGSSVQTQVQDETIIVLKNGVTFYVVEDITCKSPQNYGFEVICHFGAIMGAVREIEAKNENRQLSFV